MLLRSRELPPAGGASRVRAASVPVRTSEDRDEGDSADGDGEDDERKLRALETVPGAVLLLAIVRRSILPKETRVQCRRCCEMATAEHVLLADDDTHNEADFALKHGPAVLHVARRVKALCDDPLAARWSTLITTYSV
ncbi:hypothetical protein DIPPA_14123 [Diplonema papillatum]|nr:hypothetical protein DIPPA_14123 [Diplonema papillatum]